MDFAQCRILFFLLRMNKHNSKLLSHRLRGLSEFEHSADSFKQIGSLKIKYFELDTRVSKDGEIYVCHNNAFMASGKTHKIAHRTSEQISTLNHQQANPLLLLKEALQLFSAHSSQDQLLCIDIKDYGYEKEHLDLVREYRLERRVIFITWIPQTIIRLKELNTRSALIFSFWNVSKLKLLGRLISHSVSRLISPLGQYIVIGEKRITDSLQGLSVGYQHALFSTELPELLLNLLVESGGGICIHKSMYCRETGEYCKANNIQLWLYNENNRNKYRRLADNEHVDVIFSDVASDLSRQEVE